MNKIDIYNIYKLIINIVNILYNKEQQANVSPEKI